MTNISSFPVPCLDSSYSQYLNRECLFIAVKTVSPSVGSDAVT